MIRISVVIIFFLVIGALFIISNENLALINLEERREFVKLYIIWISSIGDNLKEITGQIIASDWIPQDK